MASVVAKPAPTAAPISSLKYGKCHLSGASTTPSREMKKFDLILRMRGPPGLGCVVTYGEVVRRSPSGEDGIHLGDRPGVHRERAPALQSLHVLARGEDEAQLHARAAVVLRESHPHRGRRRLGVRSPVSIRISVREL